MPIIGGQKPASFVDQSVAAAGGGVVSVGFQTATRRNTDGRDTAEMAPLWRSPRGSCVDVPRRRFLFHLWEIFFLLVLLLAEMIIFPGLNSLVGPELWPHGSQSSKAAAM